MSKGKKVLIVGAGLSGMAAAIALQRLGVSVDLVELQPAWKILGVGISVQGPALRALKAIGLIDRCVQQGFGYSSVVNCDVNGTPVGTVRLPNLNGPEYPACVGIMRPTLHQVLADAMAEEGIRVRFGTSVESLHQTDGRVDVQFSDGGTGAYALVLGADGANSSVRRLLFGEAQTPRYTGQSVWRATVSRPAAVDARYAYYGPRHKAGINPVSQSEMYVYLVQNVSGDPRLDPARWPEVMRDLLVDFGGYIGKARDEITDPARIVYRPITSLLLPSPWYVGRVLLIGDAAHTAAPHLASGASIAVEDSIVLAELVRAGKPVTAILEQFMRRRYERCRMVVENSLQLGEWEKHPNAPDSDPTRLIAQSMKVLAEPA